MNKAWARSVVLLLALAACLCAMSHEQIANGWTILQGDRYDGVIVNSILEHWRNVFTGKAAWTDAAYFYPYARTIANTDGYFLVGLAYTPFRLLGADPFLATELAGLVIKAIGFYGMYFLCRRALSLGFWWALLAAVLFTLNNAMTIRGWRYQLATVALAPVLALLLWEAVTALMAGNGRRLRRFGIAAGVLYGAWCITCFYMAWFFTLFACLLVPVMLVMTDVRQLGRRIKAQAASLAVVLLAALLSLSPFLYAYLPKASEVGVRDYGSAKGFLMAPGDVLQVGKGNLFNDLFLHNILPAPVMPNEYDSVGVALVLLALFLVALVRQRHSAPLLRGLAITAILSWALTLKIDGVSAWYLVYHAFPGAKALRVVRANQLFLALPVVLVAVAYLARQRWPRAVMLPLAALLIAEELNSPYLQLDRQAEIARVALPRMPPAGCEAFYVSGWQDAGPPDPHTDDYAHNVSAMLIAQAAGLPTINGIASFNPPDWEFDFPHRPDYEARVRRYAMLHKIHALCRLELNSKQWSKAEVPAPPPLGPVTTLDFGQDAPRDVLVGTVGLSSNRDPWGAWTAGKRLSLEFATPLPARFTLVFTANAFGPNVGKTFVVHAGSQEARFTLGTQLAEQRIELSNPDGATRLDFDIPKPVTPQQLGLSDDTRPLGMGLASLHILQH